MQIIEKYFTKLTDIQRERFEKLLPLYQEWNEKINVISRKDLDNFYERHVLHSLAIAKYIKFNDDTKILDLGTGGGFPAIPLAIYFENVQFLCVDSIEKKTTVVQAVIDALELKNIKVQHTRVEKVEGHFDFVISRAVAPLPELLNWVRNKIHPISFNRVMNGVIALKGGDLKEEISLVRRKVITKSISDYFDEEFFETKQIVYVPLK